MLLHAVRPGSQVKRCVATIPTGILGNNRFLYSLPHCFIPSSFQGQTMKMTMGAFARQAGINKATLSRMIKAGKISAERQENGRLLIDPAELDRLADIRFTST